MIRRRPVVSIFWPSDYGSGVTEDTKLIQYVDSREPQLHKMWCLGLDNFTCKIQLTVQVEVGAGTVGEFTTNHFAENGHIIRIIGQLYINGSVQFLGITNFFWNSGLLFILKNQAPTVPSGWGNSDTTNRNWGVIPGRPYRNVELPGVVLSLPIWIICLGVPLTCALLHDAAQCVCDDFLCLRCRMHMRIPTNSRNPIVNPRIYCRGDNWEGPVTQYFCCKISLLVSATFLFFLSLV